MGTGSGGAWRLSGAGVPLPTMVNTPRPLEALVGSGAPVNVLGPGEPDPPTNVGMLLAPARPEAEGAEAEADSGAKWPGRCSSPDVPDGSEPVAGGEVGPVVGSEFCPLEEEEPEGDEDAEPPPEPLLDDPPEPLDTVTTPDELEPPEPPAPVRLPPDGGVRPGGVPVLEPVLPVPAWLVPPLLPEPLVLPVPDPPPVLLLPPPPAGVPVPLPVPDPPPEPDDPDPPPVPEPDPPVSHRSGGTVARQDSAAR